MKWTQDQLAKLRELASDGKSNSEIAQALCMPIAEIYAKRSSLGLTITKVQTAKGGKEINQKENLGLDTRGQNNEKYPCSNQPLMEHTKSSSHERKEVISAVVQIVIQRMEDGEKGNLTTAYVIGILQEAIVRLESNALMTPAKNYLLKAES